ncbi:MAG: hypothetical protein M1830_000343 [Pleopsidium flavum]|nr:MAG: hypothetical protein M1830_000343 [Pleopsidium flavum]
MNPPSPTASAKRTLKKSDIIPDGIPLPYLQIIRTVLNSPPTVLDDFHPSISLTISYPSAHESVDLGNTISPSDVESAPAFELHAPSTSLLPITNTNTIYTLILTDPDATSRSSPKMSEMCHWIATNLTLSPSLSTTSSAVSISPLSHNLHKTTDELISYLAPSPPPKTGKHRYVFVLLAGPEGKELKKPEERPHWGYGKVRHGVRDWAQENGLVIVGANFFYSQNKKQ